MNYEKIFQLILKHGLFVCPLNNGDWMIGKGNHIYHMSITDDHYKDDALLIEPTLPEAVEKWIKQNEI